jgi:hypothetical protein
VHDERFSIDLVVSVIFTRVIRDEPFDVSKADVTLLVQDREEFVAIGRIAIKLIDARQQNVGLAHVTTLVL